MRSNAGWGRIGTWCKPSLRTTAKNSGHDRLSKALDAKFYFARPYHSWERGLNEHTNGLVRQYFPKGTDFRSVTDAEVQAVEDLLNARPRKALGFRTPEVFTDAQAPP